MEGIDQTSASQERIAEAALILISERGLAAVTMSEVARQAGVARQTLYNHYADVESIVTAIIEQHEAMGLAQVSRLLEGHTGAASKLEQLVRHSVTMGAHGRALASLESSLSPGAQESLRVHRDRTEEIVKGILREGVAEGAFRSDLDPDVDAAFVREVLLASADRTDTEDVAGLASATVRFVLAAVQIPQR